MERNLPYGKEYIILSCYKNKDELSRSVNSYLARGWRVTGGVSATYDNDNGAILFTQAIVHE